MVSKDGRAIDPKRVEAITNLAKPTTLLGLRSLLGLTQHVRDYIQGLSAKMEPIQRLCRKGADIVGEWGPEADVAFQELKDYLTTAPVLAIPDLNKKFRLHVDTCRIERGVGAVLLQIDDELTKTKGEDNWRPVAYWSRSLKDAERRYSDTELECTGLHDAIMHFDVYLRNGFDFDAIVDHYALVYMVTKMCSVEQNQRLLRICLDLQTYSFLLIFTYFIKS
jgi:hypothetical protein